MEKTILNKSNSLLKSIDNMFKSVFGEREYVDKETNQINSEKDNVVNTIKGEVIKRLRMRGRIKEEDIEIRIQGIEVNNFETFKTLKAIINLKESNVFYYSKVSK